MVGEGGPPPPSPGDCDVTDVYQALNTEPDHLQSTLSQYSVLTSTNSGDSQ